MTVGRPIVASEALSKSMNMLTGNPVLLLPQVIALIPSLLNTLISRVSSPLAAFAFIASIVSAVVGLIVSGAYPTIVKSVLGGSQFSIADAMGKAYHKFWTLLGASILVVLLVVLGLIAVVVPGIIFLTWYAYTTPAIMLEDRGATGGMAASKAFGHDKKWGTFKVFFVLFIVAFVVFIIEELFSFSGLALVGQVLGQILFVPITAWGSVIAAYIYITCGPSSTTVATGTPAPGAMPSAFQQPSTQPGTPPSPRFCSACGSSLEPGARFCRYCGKAV